jgi:hypothetical protein
MQCINRLKQIALSAHNFHDIHERFPSALRDPLWYNGTTNPVYARPGNPTQSLERVNLYGYAVMLLPFIEQGQIYDQIKSAVQAASSATSYAATNIPDTTGNANFNFGGETTTTPNPFYTAKLAAILCPSDRMGKLRTEDNDTLGRISYRYCHGDVWSYYISPHHRGVANCGDLKKTTMAAIEDGTSNTLMFSESCINNGTDNDRSVFSGIARINSTPLIPKTCSDYRGSNGQLNLPSGMAVWGAYKGMRWGDGRNSLFQAVLSPNAPACFHSNEESQMMLTVSSYHTGGANAALCDGTVRFVSSTIDTGDINIETPLNHTGYSNYGVWGAMGSINGGESSSP